MQYPRAIQANPYTVVAFLVSLLLSGIACASEPTSVPTPQPAAMAATSPVPVSTAAPPPTYAPLPTYTPYPTYTPAPTATLALTNTPEPTPTATPEPTPRSGANLDAVADRHTNTRADAGGSPTR